MIFDKELLFSDAQAVTSTGANASTNIVDLGVRRDIGRGEPLWLTIVVPTAFTSGGAGTLDFQLQTDDNSSFSSATTLWTSSAQALAALAAGAKWQVRLPKGCERYLRLNYQVATAAMTAGAITAGITIGSSDEEYAPYPRANYQVA